MSSFDSRGLGHKDAGAGRGQFDGRRAVRPAGAGLVEETSRPAREGTPGGIPDGAAALLARRAALIRDGYAPAASGWSHGTTAGSRHGIATWWEEHYRQAEIRSDGRGYPKMPDDYTPGRTGGRALSGRRRTHRMLYQGAGVAVRMPSAAAIRRYAKQNHGGTFDVPVQVQGQGGRNVSGWVRVTRNSPHAWTVDGLGMPDNIAWKVSESVAAVLESRRPSLALAQAGDLLARRRERIAAAGTRLAPAASDSSVVHGLGYNAAAGQMMIRLGDRTYGYRVAPDVYRKVAGAYSPGHMYNQLVKGHAGRVTVAQCDRCRRWHDANAPHQCRGHRPPAGTVPLYNRVVAAHLLGQASRPVPARA